MRRNRLPALLALAATLTAVAAPGAMAAATAPSAAPKAPPVLTMKTGNLGVVVATKKKLGLYTWNAEKDFKVRCTGACAEKWPPVLLMKGEKVKAMVAGIKGEFGTVRRPDGSTQLTLNRQPVYTYHGDSAGIVLCDNVDGWFAVRAAGKA